ncbi:MULTISPECIES: metal-dependent hydrolase [unclassified Cupriavidus]|uniref:metal-dependent hydrolase n=1 Tax=unclassified Cupriavidus TaxID=2640874 RepID=UPI001C0036B3|nr:MULTISPECIES: metal-dependent hydrolase [unclassified Cupriavidus]MCA3183193.1 metal-dependent hydrolase [Cupriavidus sp.]MCA3192292.1 metal-dependent hydrolase [Cupriavidus sp.]MCA3196067.1 metal-dependent hydrolase [Cupriavidus sp.]MCA3203600.1 metal-dependent hydrolase [Cupriavidus sp.]MCA3206314.1 metal-dependent hydrolase [Cupriavidus sp.]
MITRRLPELSGLQSCARQLLLVSAIGLLTACASNVSNPPVPAQPSAPAAAAAPVAAGKTEVLWLGQAAMRITTPGGKVIVVDPWLTGNPKTPAPYKQLSALGKVDLILVTHAHGDHLGDAVELAKLNNAPLWNAGGLSQQLVTLGQLPATQAMRFGKSGTIAPLGDNGPKITAVHAEHSSELVWKNPATGKDETHYGGEPVGYIIEMENGFKIWHMGDTGLYGDMMMVADRYKPDLVLIPIGGHFTMGPQDAAIALRDFIKPKYAIPMHYGTSPMLRGTPAELKTALGASAPTAVIVPEPGQKVDF